MKFLKISILILLMFSLSCSSKRRKVQEGQEASKDKKASVRVVMPYGTDAEVLYAKELWEKLEKRKIVGEEFAIFTKPQSSQAPHGPLAEILYMRVKHKGHVGKAIVYRQYEGVGVDVKSLMNNRMKFMRSINVMFQREKGYDEDNKNWFWAKYTPKGGLHKNAFGVHLAGRVEKGKDRGCISCHSGAPDGDYIFSNVNFPKID